MGAIRALIDEALRSMSVQLERLYSMTGRPSIFAVKIHHTDSSAMLIGEFEKNLRNVTYRTRLPGFVRGKLHSASSRAMKAISASASLAPTNCVI